MKLKTLLFPFLQPAKKKQRAQVIEFFIDVARECFNIGNFNSLMAIICESKFGLSKNMITKNYSARPCIDSLN